MIHVIILNVTGTNAPILFDGVTNWVAAGQTDFYVSGTVGAFNVSGFDKVVFNLSTYAGLVPVEWLNYTHAILFGMKWGAFLAISMFSLRVFKRFGASAIRAES